LLAVGLHAGAARYQYLFESFEQGQRATGTFVNPDHLAGYLELCLSAGLGLMLGMLGAGARPQRWRERLVAWAGFMMSAKMLLRLGLVAMVIALVLTRSRMGNGAFFISMLLVGALVAAVSLHLRRPALWLVASMVLIDLVVIGQWVGLDRVAARMTGTAEASSASVAAIGLEGPIPPPREGSLAERLEVPMASLPLIAQRPLTGWGGGAYALAFAPIKPDTAYAGFWDHAHNDYVQVAVETGLIGFALWLGIGLLSAWRAWPLLKDGQPGLNRGIGVAALMALSCLGLHSLVDFNLYIPANALTFAVLLGLVWAAPQMAPEPVTRASRRRRPHLPLDDD
jgi:O-antigen ligase